MLVAVLRDGQIPPSTSDVASELGSVLPIRSVDVGT